MVRKILVVAVIVVAFGCERADRNVGRSTEHDERPDDSTPVVLFFGTSLTAGYGLAADRAYPALIQQKIDSAGYRFRVVNAGESGATSAGGVRRISWLLQQPVAVLVLELGANDGLRGTDPAVTKLNLEMILDSTAAKCPDCEIVVAAMEAPPNLGVTYTTEFRELFVALASERGATLLPFLLDGVAGIPELNQPDGIHPTERGHRIVAANVWRVLEPVLRRVSSKSPAATPSSRPPPGNEARLGSRSR